MRRVQKGAWLDRLAQIIICYDHVQNQNKLDLLSPDWL